MMTKVLTIKQIAIQRGVREAYTCVGLPCGSLKWKMLSPGKGDRYERLLPVFPFLLPMSTLLQSAHPNLWLCLFIPSMTPTNSPLPSMRVASSSSPLLSSTMPLAVAFVAQPIIFTFINYCLASTHHYLALYNDGIDALQFLNADGQWGQLCLWPL